MAEQHQEAIFAVWVGGDDKKLGRLTKSRPQCPGLSLQTPALDPRMTVSRFRQFRLLGSVPPSQLSLTVHRPSHWGSHLILTDSQKVLQVPATFFPACLDSLGLEEEWRYRALSRVAGRLRMTFMDFPLAMT